MLSDTIFRRYDIRGVVGTEFDLDEVERLTLAIAYYFKEKNPALKTVAVGMDGRLHSAIIKEMMCRTLQACGLDVVFVGLCPSPVFYFSLHQHDVDAGLMITASHNPSDYNGIKIRLGTKPVWGDEIQYIKKLYKQATRLRSSEQGYYHEQIMVEPYVAWCAHHFKHLQGLLLPMVIDCGNGAAGGVMPALVNAMGWQGVELLHAEIDGTFPHHEADPTIEENMREVKNRLACGQYLFGCGFDGDGDRFGVMTPSGRLILGDELLGLFAAHLLKDHPCAAIVSDIKASLSLSELVEQYGGRHYWSPSGHSLVDARMRETKALLAGELSCHFFFADRYFGYDDGIYAFMRLIEILATTDASLEDLLQVYPRRVSSPELRVPCNGHDPAIIINTVKQSFEQNPDCRELITIDGIRVTMPYGWGLIRASHTQPLLSLRFEADSDEGLERIKDDFSQILVRYL